MFMKILSFFMWILCYIFKGCNELSWYGDKNSGFRDDEFVCVGVGFYGVVVY